MQTGHAVLVTTEVRAVTGCKVLAREDVVLPYTTVYGAGEWYLALPS